MASFYSGRWALVLRAALLIGVLCPQWAGAEVPHKDAVPAYAEEQTILQVERNTPESGFGSTASGRVHVDRHYLGQYGTTEGTVLVQRGGNTWRVLRNGPIAAVSGAVLLVVPLVLFGFYLVTGPAHRDRRETGRRIERFNRWQRVVHWATAFSFIAMAVTGLIILFGKKIMLPWMGHELFSWVAAFGKFIHNFVGPLFIACSVLLFVTFVRKNAFRRWDWQWIKSFGGLLSHKHVPAGYFNAGEKLWFWGGVVLLGLLMSVTGLILDFVNFGQTRYVLQLADYFHLAGATLYIAAAMGHIYIGTLGTPGAYQAMRDGTVDEAWAQTHHEIWYNELGGGAPPPASGHAAPARPGHVP